MKFFSSGNSYNIHDAKIVGADGVPMPIPAPRFITANDESPTTKFIASESVSLQTTITDSHFWDMLFQTRAPKDVFFIDEQGTVMCVTRIALSDGVSDRYYETDALDRAVWRYALASGLQIEDAVRELNRNYSIEELKIDVVE